LCKSEDKSREIKEAVSASSQGNDSVIYYQSTKWKEADTKTPTWLNLNLCR
ncbi:unnamed protein product, partial [Linum tenue]